MNRSALSNAEVRLLYEGGAKAARIAELAGVSERAIRKRLARMAVPMRTRQDYPANMAAAHVARRGNTDPIERREARARTRERLQLGTSAVEDYLARALDELGIAYIRQRAIGPYNVDFLIGTVVVEVNGGGHNPRVRAKAPERLAYLEGLGYTVLSYRPQRQPHWVADVLRVVTAPSRP